MIARISALLALAAVSALAVGTAFGCGSSQPCESTDCASGTGGKGSGGAGGTGGSGGSGGQGPTTFACKDVMCKIGVEECDVQMDDVGPDVGTCLPLPASCKPAPLVMKDCSCYSGLAPGCECQQIDGNFVIFCAPMP